MSIALRSCLVLGLALVPLACGSDGGGPMDPPDELDVSGSYAATFEGTAMNCGGLVPDGNATGTLVVTQNGDMVTLNVTALNDAIRNNPTGTIDADGNFTFTGPITVGNDDGTVDADGTITGTFGQDGSVDLDFEFSAFTCVVDGTITGQR